MTKPTAPEVYTTAEVAHLPWYTRNNQRDVDHDRLLATTRALEGTSRALMDAYCMLEGTDSRILALLGRVKTSEALVAELMGVLEELADLVDAARSGEYVVDTFTTQPAREALARSIADDIIVI